MAIKQYKISKRLLLVINLLFIGLGVKAQTQVTAPMTNTPAPGEYFSTSSITLNPDFSFTATAGNSFHAYILSPDCSLINNGFSANQNFVVTSVPRIPMNTFTLTGKTSCDIMQSVAYFDGLGRPLQTVQVKGSPANRDVVQPVIYDQFGRETQKYLPYTATGADGSFKGDALTSGAGVFNFYYPSGSTAVSGAQQNNGIVYNPAPYGVTNFDSSPLNRVEEQGAPGTDWQPITGSISGHTVKTTYKVNNVVGFIDTANTYQVALYSATVNADQTRTLVLGNANGNYYQAGQLTITIAKDENNKNTRGGSVEEYKDKDGHVVLKRAFNFTGGVLQILSTYYVYDDLGNLAFVLPPKSNADNALPSQAILNNLCYQYRYDEQNRLTQKKIPGENRDWEYMVYNKQGQIVLSQDGRQRVTNQWTASKYDALGRVIMTGLWNAGSVIPLSTLQGSIYSGDQWDVRNYTDNNTGYSVTSYPALSSILTINYYDDYINIPGKPSQYSAPAGANPMTTGLLTATKTAILGSSNMLLSVNYYDDLGRTIQSYRQHYLGGGIPNAGNYDVITNTYDFSNAVISSTRNHYTSANATNPAVTIVSTLSYDHMGRRIDSFEQINGGTNVLLSRAEYNELGQLKIKHLHSETGSTPFLQDIAYAYNERGWLRTAGDASNQFSYELRYNNSTDAISKQYNGNIAELLYKGPASGSKNFIYSYDQLNRLGKALSNDGLLNEQLSYDTQGNIASLSRTGNSSASLTYTYQSSGQSNQLQTVTNSGSAYRSYTYDANGNATGDGVNKTIGYNLLNLPQTVTQGTSTLATYTYDAGGQKLRNTGSDGSWDYINGIVYNNNAISFIQTEEGRAIPNGGNYHYEYNLSDNLGNVRVSFDKNPANSAVRTLQEDEYYAFGLRSLKQDNSNNNRYLYNGKEIQTDLSNQYDYGARFYDPVIARWNVIDPKAEADRRWSVYVYGFDNAIRFEDPDGMEAEEGGCCDVPSGGPVITNMPRTVGGHLVSTAGFNSPAPIPKMDAETLAGGLAISGTATAGAGYVFAPFTGGASLELVPIGEGISSLSSAISATKDVSDGHYGSALTTIALDRGFGSLGKVVEESKGITSVGKVILRGTAFAANKIAENIAEKFKADHEQKKEVKEAPKLANTKANKDSEKNAKEFFKKAEEKEKKKK
ncbi:DUF6443 domain-containing protein [Mucilaginibacter sp. SG564]|uniref:DUF6443 domain-containing protein n=1 Tax=Mucilaginibacter sp. SG564 TaxID=2587022 RepID=UPI001556BABD|nr:DUF6443 domain-containing protein [Mucilaginibacter sp. SG564]NOW98955.1 RHS repeat-associated protein [Mucilaginibacter sp. SG564]